MSAKIDTSYQNLPNNTDIDHIPGKDGLPFLGRMINIVTDYLNLIDEHYTKWGKVSRIKMIPNRAVMILGADNWQRILLDKEKNYSPQMGYKDTLGQFYDGGLLLLDYDEHKLSRRLMQTAFKNAAMSGYVKHMTPIIDQHVSSWGDQVDFFPAIKKVLLEVGSQVFVGINDEQRAKKFNAAFLDINEGLVGVVKKEWPITAYGRGQTAKSYLLGEFESLVPQRHGSSAEDMLTYMSNETQENGEKFPVDDISKHVIFLLFAAHDTTTSALSHIMYFTAKYPEWQKKMREECLALGKDNLEYEDLDRLEIMDMVFDEAQRLRPSVPLMMRRTIRECEFDGVTIPANTVICLPTPFNHRDPEHWTNPLEFDPMRFSKEREEHKNHPFAYHPFGGGAHKCIGMHFARMLVKTFLYQFLRNYEYSMPQDFDVKFEWFPLPKPKKLPLNIKPL